jgi:hypothetical protein
MQGLKPEAEPVPQARQIPSKGVSRSRETSRRGWLSCIELTITTIREELTMRGLELVSRRGDAL